MVLYMRRVILETATKRRKDIRNTTRVKTGFVDGIGLVHHFAEESCVVTGSKLLSTGALDFRIVVRSRRALHRDKCSKGAHCCTCSWKTSRSIG